MTKPLSPSQWSMMLAIAPILMPYFWPAPFSNFANSSYIKTSLVLLSASVFIPCALILSMLDHPYTLLVFLLIWSYGIWKFVLKVLPMVHYRAKMAIYNRLEAWESAEKRYNELINMKRLIQTSKYDAYLPVNNNVEVRGALLLIPGALVDSTAYSVICSRIADCGIMVVMLRCEPFRLPSNHLGVNSKSVTQIFYDIERQFGKMEWLGIGGHSLGSRVALEISGPLGVSKIVVWGGASLDLAPRNSSILLLNGSNDGIIGSSPTGIGKPQPGVKVESRSIVGGNHAGFGHYGPQTYPCPDGELSIPIEEMQDIVSQETVAFLLGHPGERNIMYK